MLVCYALFRTDGFNLALDCIKHIPWDYRLVVALCIVLWYLAVVLPVLLCQEVLGKGLLQKGVSDVFFICEYALYVVGPPFHAVAGRRVSLRREGSCYPVHAHPREEQGIYPSNYHRLVFIEGEPTVFSSVVSEEAGVGEGVGSGFDVAGVVVY